MKRKEIWLFASFLLLIGCQKDNLTVSSSPQDLGVEFRSSGKLLVCHKTYSETNPWELIDVSDVSYVKAHQEHGDAQPGEAIPEMPGYMFGCNCEVVEGGVFEDIIETAALADGRIWTVENLDIEPDGYTYGTDFWWYEDDEQYADYGLLYTWDAANAACAELGEGWRLPTRDEYWALIAAYDGNTEPWDENKIAFQKLIDGGESGFDALLGGSRYYVNGNFSDLGKEGDYWGAPYDENMEQYLPVLAFFAGFTSPTEFTVVGRNQEPGFGLSCRCIKSACY